MIIVPYRAEHLKQIIEQPATKALSGYLRDDHMAALEASAYSFTGMVNGRVVGCAGVVSMWPGRGEAWAILDRGCGRHMAAVHKAAKRFFEVCPLQRIELIVSAGFQEGHRWAQMLGFVLQTPLPMEKYLPTGEAAYMYARVQHV